MTLPLLPAGESGFISPSGIDVGSEKGAVSSATGRVSIFKDKPRDVANCSVLFVLSVSSFGIKIFGAAF